MFYIISKEKVAGPYTKQEIDQVLKTFPLKRGTRIVYTSGKVKVKSLSEN